MRPSTLLITLCIIFLSCNNSKIDQDAETLKLMEVSRQWAMDAQTGNHEAILSYWSADAIVLMPGQPSFKGHDAIRKMFEDTSQIPGFEINLEPKETSVSESGNLGYVIGNNYVKVADSLGNSTTNFNKAVEIWKKQGDGSWKNAVDIFNSDPTLTSIR